MRGTLRLPAVAGCFSVQAIGNRRGRHDWRNPGQTNLTIADASVQSNVAITVVMNALILALMIAPRLVDGAPSSECE